MFTVAGTQYEYYTLIMVKIIEKRENVYAIHMIRYNNSVPDRVKSYQNRGSP